MTEDDRERGSDDKTKSNEDQYAQVRLPGGHLVVLSSLTDSMVHLLEEFQSQLQKVKQQAQPVQQSRQNQHLDEAIHVVELLFNVVFYESDITQDTKILMARLQMIYVKIASRDESFYHRNDHPARVVLSQLIKLAKNSSNPEVHQEIKKIVEYIITHHGNDAEVFQTILNHFNKKAEHENQSPESSQQLEINSENGKSMDHTVKAYIHSTLQGGSVKMLPEAAKNFIQGPWQAFLYQVAVGESIGSSAWDASLKTLSEFVGTLDLNYDWSTQASQDKQKKLRKTIQLMLDTLDMSPEEKNYWLDLIQGCWHTQKEKSSSSVIKLHKGAKSTDPSGTSSSSKATESKCKAYDKSTIAEEESQATEEEAQDEVEIEEIEITAPSPFGKF